MNLGYPFFLSFSPDCYTRERFGINGAGLLQPDFLHGILPTVSNHYRKLLQNIVICLLIRLGLRTITLPTSGRGTEWCHYDMPWQLQLCTLVVTVCILIDFILKFRHLPHSTTVGQMKFSNKGVITWVLTTPLTRTSCSCWSCVMKCYRWAVLVTGLHSCCCWHY